MSDEYSKFLYIEGLPELDQTAVTLSDWCMELGAPGSASRVRRAYAQLLDGLRDLAIQMSAKATEALIDAEHRTRVRPDTEGDGGERLEDWLVAEPLNELPGSVGINNETLLDEHVPWWPTNEVGSSARVGGRVSGFFYGPGFTDMSAPSAEEFREHPIFAPEGDAPGMVITRPIPARRFVLEAINQVDPQWHQGVRTLRANLEREWDLAVMEARRVALLP